MAVLVLVIVAQSIVMLFQYSNSVKTWEALSRLQEIQHKTAAVGTTNVSVDQRKFVNAVTEINAAGNHSTVEKNASKAKKINNDVAQKNVSQPINDSPLPIVLIVQGLYLQDLSGVNNETERDALDQENRERLAIFESYRPFFHHMIYDTPIYIRDHETACNAPALQKIKHANPVCHTCTRIRTKRDTVRYGCASDAMEQYLAAGLSGASDVAGMLVIHADFFLSTAILDFARRALNEFPDAYWLPTSIHHPFPVDQDGRIASDKLTTDPAPTNFWQWKVRRQKFPEKTDAARREIAESLGMEGLAPLPADGKKTFIYWCDIYYVPRNLWEHFFSFSRIFTHHAILNEIAVPSTLRLASHLKNASKGLALPSLGSCCIERQAVNIQNQTYNNQRVIGGHRLDIRRSDERVSAARIWADEVPPLSTMQKQ